MKPCYAVTVFLDCWESTEKTILDLVMQDVSGVLAINNGSSERTRKLFDAFPFFDNPPILPWHHNPPLPSLAATWNEALRFCWAAGAEEALVVNNDTRLNRETLSRLRAVRATTGALFVSAVNTGEVPETLPSVGDLVASPKGGPDFSCFLVTREGHERFPFDENCVPCYIEDLRCHRDYMVGGEGHRIFSVPLPYNHISGGSGTLKSMDPERRAERERQISEGSRAYYQRCYGGGVNEEKWLFPFNRVPEGFVPCPEGCVTTPQLQRHGCGGRA